MFATLEQVTEEHFDHTFGMNVRGLLFTVQKALPLLNDGASVILPASTAATAGTEAFGVYAASKAAVRSFARTWANELKARGIRVKGFLATQVPLGRMGRPEEIADAVLFLATSQSSFITGADLHVDGGMHQSHCRTGTDIWVVRRCPVLPPHALRRHAGCAGPSDGHLSRS